MGIEPASRHGVFAYVGDIFKGGEGGTESLLFYSIVLYEMLTSRGSR